MHRIDFEKLKPGEILYKITDVGIIPCVIEDIDTSRYNAEITFKNGDRASLSQRTDTRSGGNKKTYFMTETEAKKHLEETEKIKEKKKKMYEYELELNKELGIEDILIKY